MIAFWRATAPYLHAHPPHPGIRELTQIAIAAGRHPRRIARASRIMMMTPRAVLDSTLENEAVRSALANFAAASASPLDQPGSRHHPGSDGDAARMGRNAPGRRHGRIRWNIGQDRRELWRYLPDRPAG